MVRRGALLVEVEVARGALLEPEPVVLRRLLEELRRLLEDVLTLGLVLLEGELRAVLVAGGPGPIVVLGLVGQDVVRLRAPARGGRGVRGGVRAARAARRPVGLGGLGLGA